MRDCQIPESFVKEISILRAGSVGAVNPPVLSIKVGDQISEDMTIESAKELYADQATKLVDALLESLPGGTVDAMLVELLRRKATLLRVPMMV